MRGPKLTNAVAMTTILRTPFSDGDLGLSCSALARHPVINTNNFIDPIGRAVELLRHFSSGGSNRSELGSNIQRQRMRDDEYSTGHI